MCGSASEVVGVRKRLLRAVEELMGDDWWRSIGDRYPVAFRCGFPAFAVCPGHAEVVVSDIGRVCDDAVNAERVPQLACLCLNAICDLPSTMGKCFIFILSRPGRLPR